MAQLRSRKRYLICVADDVVHKCDFLKCTRAQSNDLSIPYMEINIGLLYRILYVVYTIEHL